MNRVKSMFFKFIKRKELVLFLILLSAGLSLFGWYSGSLGLSSFSLKYKPVSPIIGIAFIVLTLIYILDVVLKKSRFTKTILTFSLIILGSFFLIIFLDFIFNFTFDIESILIKNIEKFGKGLPSHMSPIASLLFVITCAGFLLSRYNNSNLIRCIRGSLSLLVSISSSIMLLGYFYRAPLLYGSTIIPVALPAVICFFLVGLILIRSLDLRFWPFDLISGNKIALQLIKSFGPFIASILILQGFLQTILPTEKNNPTLTIALIVISVFIITFLIVFKFSATLGDKLERAEQVMAENLKNKSLNYYTRSLIEVSLDPLVTIGIDGKITDVNIATENATGFSRETLIGSDFSCFFTEPGKAIIGYKRVLEEKFIVDYPLTIHHKSNKLMNVMFNGSVYYNEEGELIGVFAAARDITQLKESEEKLKLKINELTLVNEAMKRVEEELLNLNVMLENEVGKRTADLVNANKELEQFAYVAAHDLQEPLRMVSSYTQLLETRYKDKLDEDANDFIHFAVDGAVRMQRLLNDLLYYSRIGFKTKDYEQVDTAHVLGNTIANLQQVIVDNTALITNN